MRVTIGRARSWSFDRCTMGHDARNARMAVHAVMDIPLSRIPRDRPPAVLMGDLTLARSLGMAGIPSIIVTADPRDITIHSKYALGHCVIEPFTPASTERTAATLLDLSRRLKPVVRGKIPLFYGNDAQLAFLHRYREPLSDSFAFLLNDDALGTALRDKEKFCELTRRKGVPVPRTARADEQDAVAKLHPPIVVKPRDKVAWKHLQRELFDGCGKARIFDSTDELLRHPAFERHRSELLVQECISDTIADLLSFHGFADDRGELLAYYCGRKIRTFPAVGGESSFIELTRDHRLEELGIDVTRRLGLRGIFKIDVVRDSRDDSLYVLEINARFNLWNYLGAVHGVNLPEIAYRYLVDGEREHLPIAYQPRVRWLNFYRDAKACMEGRKNGSLQVGRWAASLASSRKIYEAFAWSDPEPFAWWLADYLRKRVFR